MPSAQSPSCKFHAFYGKVNSERPTDSLPAGGRGTEAGMAFQAGVGLWFAAHLVAKMPVGSRFGLDDAAYPVSLQLEAGVDLDDIIVKLSNGGKIAIQCKTRPSLSRSENSDLGKTIVQVVSFISASLAGARDIDLEKSAAVMAVAPSAPGSLTSLSDVCRAFASGDDWEAVSARVSKAERRAMSIFRQHVSSARESLLLPPPMNDDLVLSARLFHIERFAIAQGETDWREASRILGSRVYGDEERGAAPLADLLHIVRNLIRQAVRINRDGLLRLLRAKGHDDTRSPHYDNDIAQLSEKTQAVIPRLCSHAVLPIAGGVSIDRACMPAFRAAAESGSFLLVGEPGSGKTGVLVAFVQERLTANQTTILMAVDDFSGIRTERELQDALNLRHPLIEVLSAWPGCDRGMLVIDALDATRGEHSSKIFANLIQDVQTRLADRWSVVASIRLFDLVNGRQFRNAMKGNPPNPAYIECTVDNVRHFFVESLTDEEIAEVAQKEARLGALLSTASAKVASLLRNLFNLSLAADLLEAGRTTESFAADTTQSDLITRYEDQRLYPTDLQDSVSRAVGVMVEQRRLSVKRINVAHPALDQVLAEGVLVASNDLVRFAHHILFDHAAFRFYLDWNDPRGLITQMSGTTGLGLLLGPSLRFVIERIWNDEPHGRRRCWELVCELVSTPEIDPILLSAALRSITEHVNKPEDISSLCTKLAQAGQSAQMGRVLSKLTRFAGLSLAEHTSISDSVACAWVRVAVAAADTQQCAYADGVLNILQMLLEKANFANLDFQYSFGRAARELLALTWAADSAVAPMAPNAIHFVSKSFGSDSAASRRLLQQILDEPRFSEHAHAEAPELAKGVGDIFSHDPSFVVSIYGSLFERSAPSEGDTWLSNSRIMPLTSNRRQDYEISRWHLQQALPGFLQASPAEATRAVNKATLGISSSFPYGESSHHEIPLDERSICIVEDRYSFQEWRGNNAYPDACGSILSAFVDFLRECQRQAFRLAVNALLQEGVGSASVWARLLGIAAERPGLAEDLLWPIATKPELWLIPDLVRDCAFYVASSYPTVTAQQRSAFEELLWGRLRSDQEEADCIRHWAARLLSVLKDDQIGTSALRNYKIQLEETGALIGNRPLVAISTYFEDPDDHAVRFAGPSGVKPEDEPDRQVLDATESLARLLSQNQESSSLDLLDRLWDQVLVTVDVIDEQTLLLQEKTKCRALGKISVSLEYICAAYHYSPERGHPSLEQLLSLLDRLVKSPYPEASSNSSVGFLFRGEWNVREAVASSLMLLAKRFANHEPSLLERLAPMLDDPVTSVRYQVAGSLHWLLNVEPECMWVLLEKVANEEANRCAVGYFVDKPLRRVAIADASRAEPLLATVIARFPFEGNSSSSEDLILDQALGNIAAQLYVFQGRESGLLYLRNWAQSVGDYGSFLKHAVLFLGESLFLRYKEDVACGQWVIHDRALRVFRLVATAAADALPDAHSACRDSLEGSREWEAGLRIGIAATSILQCCVDRLYYGSGACERINRQDEILLDSRSKKNGFILEYDSILGLIGNSCDAGALYHLLLLYEFILEGNPEVAFDRIFRLLVGPAAREGLHREPLAFAAVVRIMKLYLADHFELFEHPDRRSDLIRVLSLFADQGWPEALRLLYELPDLMR